MADGVKHIYLTKSGRKSKQKFTSYNFRDKNQKIYKMPIVPEDRLIDTEGINVRERDQEGLNRLREELAQTRRDLEAIRAAIAEQQNQQRNVLRQASENGQNRVNADEIETIISSVQNFNVDIKIPKFKDESTLNPMEFVEGLEKFFKIKNIKEDRKMLVVEHSLEGRASLWLDLRKEIQSYNEFKERFLDEFYSVPVRVQFKNS